MVKPKISAVQPEPHVPWDVDGTILMVGTGDDQVVIDLEERQTDSQVIIDICRCPSGLMEGVCGIYVLSAEIPPRRYREEIDESAANVSAPENTEIEGEGASVPSIKLVPEPFDMASVVLSLWTYENPNTEMEENING